MENSISSFCKTLGFFCKHIQTSCDSLKESIDRRPIPLDSASSTFIQRLTNRISSVSGNLSLMHSMALETVSFEELLGHCNEIYKKNQNDLTALEDHIKNLGYVPETEIYDEDEVSNLRMSGALELKFPSLTDEGDGLTFACRSVGKMLEEESLMEDSRSLKDFGLSDVCLATLASEGEPTSPEMSLPMSYNDGKQHQTVIDQPNAKVFDMQVTTKHCPLKFSGTPRHDPKSFGGAIGTSISISKDDYDGLPSYMKSLASWEDLQQAVEKMNSTLCMQERPKGENLFNQDEIASLGLGPKAKSYLLLLIRLNQVVVETVSGSTAYRVVNSKCK